MGHTDQSPSKGHAGNQRHTLPTIKLQKLAHTMQYIGDYIVPNEEPINMYKCNMFVLNICPHRAYN